MRKLFFFLLMIPFLISCNQQKVKTLEERNDSLVQAAYEKDQSLNEFLQAFNDIQGNLDSIKAKEMIISEKTENKSELKKKAKDQINDDINSIYDLLLDTREKLDDVRKKLGKSNYQVKEMEKMLASLSKQLEEKDQQIEDLRVELEKMNIKVTNLTEDVTRLSKESKEKSSVIEDQNQMLKEKADALNTAYYVIGTKKDLKENNIITSEGGFIGIGSSEVLKDDFNESHFTRIDIRNTNVIAIPGKKIEIVTTHPSESYTIDGEGDERKLVINNTGEFWKSSRYLVIIVQ
jgi:peptidoglycan hydrolase CwlO-like protein